MKPILTILAALALSLVGPACGEDKKGVGEKSAGPPPAAKQADPKPAEPAPDPAPEEAAVPTTEDFEEEAEKQITEDGLEKEVEKLEAEVGD